jgi:hypothetical protein
VPNGALTLVFATIGVMLFAQRVDQAYATAVTFMVGVALSGVFAAIIEFAVLPGALMAEPWQTVIFIGMAAIFLPLIAPANQMSCDTQQFYNGALAGARARLRARGNILAMSAALAQHAACFDSGARQ